MAQDLTVNIKTTSDVPQAMDKAKAATVGFGKQVDDIGKKFSMAFKDIAFAFVAPLVLLNSAMSAISGAIAKNKQDIKDAMSFAEKGESQYLRAGTVTSAREISGRKQDALDRKNAKLAAQAAAEEQASEGGFLGMGGEGDKALIQYASEGKGFFNKLGRGANAAAMFLGINSYSKNTDMQDVLERRSQARVAETPEEKARLKAQADLAASSANAAAQKASDDAAKAKGTNFKTPEGFSNVVGVGSNPVLEAMTSQLEEAKRTNDLLATIANASGGRTTSWLNAADAPAPSRASMLKSK
jgi:hypothetical protein